MKIWTLSNVLSLSRILLAVPMAILLWYGYNVLAVITGAVSSITDMLDGWIARKYNQVSEYGKIFDPLADKIFVGVTVIILLIQGRFPLWLALMVLGRDLLIALGGIIAAKRMKKVIPSDMIGKATVLILGFTIMFSILNVYFILDYAYIICAIALIYSFLHYAVRGIKKMKESEN